MQIFCSEIKVFPHTEQNFPLISGSEKNLFPHSLQIGIAMQFFPQTIHSVPPIINDSIFENIFDVVCLILKMLFNPCIIFI